MNLKILKIIGIPDNNSATVIHNDGLFRQFALFFDGNSSFLEDMVIPNADVATLHLGGVQQLQNIKLPFKPDVIINNICDPEIQTHSLALLDDMNLADVIPLINSTNGIRKTKRDELSQTLPEHKDFIIPKTYRISPLSKEDIISEAQKVFGKKPFLFRPIASHGGAGLIRIDDYESANFNSYALDGREYFITEFIDFCSDDGLYRKARFFVIDGKVYPRHFILSENWKIHASSKIIGLNESVTINEELDFINSPSNTLIQLCHHLYKHLELDFFGIDCALLPDNRAVLFESNVCMRPFSINPSIHLQTARERIHIAYLNQIYTKVKK